MAQQTNCDHCQKILNVSERRYIVRGLCKKCYNDHSIRKLYSKLSERKIKEGIKADSSLKEIDAFIEKQMMNLPAWWEDEAERQRNLDRRNRPIFRFYHHKEEE